MRSSPHCTNNEQTISEFSGMHRRSGQTSRGINSPLYTTQHEVIQQRNRGTFEVHSRHRPGFCIQPRRGDRIVPMTGWLYLRDKVYTNSNLMLRQIRDYKGTHTWKLPWRHPRLAVRLMPSVNERALAD